MSTYGAMQDRIADEIRESNLDSQIRLAIQDAIACYEHEDFWFLRDRSTTITMVANQEIYSGSSTNDLYLINDITCSDTAGTVTEVYHVDNGEFIAERGPGTASGRPRIYARFNEDFRIYPKPDKAYTLTLYGTGKLATLSSSASTNAWMTDGERLIRAKAKNILWNEVLLAPDSADAIASERAVAKYYNELRSKSTAKNFDAKVTPRYW